VDIHKLPLNSWENSAYAELQVALARLLVLVGG